MSLECYQRITDNQRECHTKLASALSAHRLREEELTQALERQRQDKDAAYRILSRDREELRLSSERRINELELLIRQQESVTIELRSTILELHTLLSQKVDVEDQLARERERNQQLTQQKETL